MKYSEDIIKEIASNSLVNATSLLSDATLLYENKRFARAYTLFQLSMEEAGKAVASMLLLSDGLTNENVADFDNTVMRLHQIKTMASSLMDIYVCEMLFRNDKNKAIEFLKNSILDNADSLNKNKNLSLYTSVHDGQVGIPDKWITRLLIEKIRFRAVSRLNAAQAWVTHGLNNLEDVKQEILNNPVEITMDSVEEFWDFLHQNNQ